MYIDIKEWSNTLEFHVCTFVGKNYKVQKRIFKNIMIWRNFYVKNFKQHPIL